jgi:hypothetical protein
MVEDENFRVEKFNGQKYQLWKMHMEDYLYQKDMFLPLGGIEKKPMTMKDKEWEVLDRNALGTIWLSLTTLVDFNISKENTTKEMMDTLAKLYEKPSTSNKVFLMKRLFNMKMSEGWSVANHLNEFNTVTNQLSSVKVDFDDEVMDLIILCSLQESWKGLFMAVSNTLKFDDVVGLSLVRKCDGKTQMRHQVMH